MEEDNDPNEIFNLVAQCSGWHRFNSFHEWVVVATETVLPVTKLVKCLPFILLISWKGKLLWCTSVWFLSRHARSSQLLCYMLVGLTHTKMLTLCVCFSWKVVSCGRAGLFSVCSLWLSLVCHCHHRLDILPLLAVESMQECDESWVATTLQVFTAQDCSSKSSFQQLWEKAGLRMAEYWYGNALSVAATFCNRSQLYHDSVEPMQGIVDCVCCKLHFLCFVADSENQRQPQSSVNCEAWNKETTDFSKFSCHTSHSHTTHTSRTVNSPGSGIPLSDNQTHNSSVTHWIGLVEFVIKLHQKQVTRSKAHMLSMKCFPVKIRTELFHQGVIFQRAPHSG